MGASLDAANGNAPWVCRFRSIGRFLRALAMTDGHCGGNRWRGSELRPWPVATPAMKDVAMTCAAVLMSATVVLSPLARAIW
jgi:hypothetical protein